MTDKHIIKIIKEFITIFIYMGLVLLSIVICLSQLALINALIQVGHPICAFFIFNFLITSIIIVGNAIINKT